MKRTLFEGRIFLSGECSPLRNPLNVVCVFLVTRGRVLEPGSVPLTLGGPRLVLTSSEMEAPCAGPPLTPTSLPSSLLRGGTKTRALSAPRLPPSPCLFFPPPPPSLWPHKSGIAHRVGLFSATLTRQVAPGDGWCWQQGLVGLLGLGLAGCEDVQRAWALARPRCLALTSGDLWSLAVEGW